MVAQRLPLIRSLQRLSHALQGVQVRQVTEREDRLQREWEQTITPALRDLYWTPTDRLDEAPEDDDDLNEWLLALLLGSLASINLRANLDAYTRASADAGGSMALELLGVGGHFHLTRREYVALLDERVAALVSAGGEVSLLRTTAGHLSSAIQQARRDQVSVMTRLPDLIAGWVTVRAHTITVDGMTWATSRAQTWTYQRNGVAEQIFVTREDGLVCSFCSPLHGRVVPVNDVPAGINPPLHVGCRCMWVPVTAGWAPPDMIWRGG